MLKIRLQRIGRRNDPSFRVVVIEHTRGPKSGNFVERVGTYNPKTKDTQLSADRIKHWLSVGAQASGRVHNMLVSAGIIKADKINVLPKKSPIVKKEEEKKEEEKKSDDSSADDSAELEEAPKETKSEDEKVDEEKPVEDSESKKEKPSDAEEDKKEEQ